MPPGLGFWSFLNLEELDRFPLPYLTRVREFSVSPWIQENRDLFQNGRIPLVLELSGWSFDNDCTTNRVQGFRSTGTENWGVWYWKGGNPILFSCRRTYRNRSTCWTPYLTTEGYLILLNYVFD